VKRFCKETTTFILKLVRGGGGVIGDFGCKKSLILIGNVKKKGGSGIADCGGAKKKGGGHLQKRVNSLIWQTPRTFKSEGMIIHPCRKSPIGNGREVLREKVMERNFIAILRI